MKLTENLERGVDTIITNTPKKDAFLKNESRQVKAVISQKVKDGN